MEKFASLIFIALLSAYFIYEFRRTYLIKRGKQAFNQQDYSKAMHYFQRVLRQEESDNHLLNYIGLTYFKLDDDQNAFIYFRKALELLQHDFSVLNNMGLVFKKQGNLERAIAYFHKACQIQPDFIAAQYNLACAHFDARQFEIACKLFHKIIQAHPTDARALKTLGAVYLVMQNETAAIEYYQKYYRLLEDKSQFDANKMADLNYLTKFGIHEEYYDKILFQVKQS